MSEINDGSHTGNEESVHSITTEVTKLVIPLNNSFPIYVRKIWVNAEEIHKHLPFAVVHASLALHMVEAALHHNNKAEQFPAKHEYDKINYYRLVTSDIDGANHKGPYDQRFCHKAKMKRNVNINPSRDYFKQTDNIHFSK